MCSMSYSEVSNDLFSDLATLFDFLNFSCYDSDDDSDIDVLLTAVILL